jgi:hypothetical protein
MRMALSRRRRQTIKRRALSAAARFFDLTRFLDANRFPPRIKSGAGFRLKTRRRHQARKTWMAGTSPAMTEERIIFKRLETA